MIISLSWHECVQKVPELDNFTSVTPTFENTIEVFKLIKKVGDQIGGEFAGQLENYNEVFFERENFYDPDASIHQFIDGSILIKGVSGLKSF